MKHFEGFYCFPYSEKETLHTRIKIMDEQPMDVQYVDWKRNPQYYLDYAPDESVQKLTTQYVRMVFYS